VGPDCYSQIENAITKQTTQDNHLHPGSSLEFKTSPPLNSIQIVDSISGTAGPSQSFAKMYYETMMNVSRRIRSFSSEAQVFINKFEIHFADYFLVAYYDFQNGTLDSTSPWHILFSNPDLRSWQLVLLGVNTHTNIDICQTLINNFSEAEIRKHKKALLRVQPAIAEGYEGLFADITGSNKYLKFMNGFTHGVAKIAGERWLYKWRKRNVKLAILYFENPDKYKKKLARVKKKKEKIDKLILKEQKFFL